MTNIINEAIANHLTMSTTSFWPGPVGGGERGDKGGSGGKGGQGSSRVSG